MQLKRFKRIGRADRIGTAETPTLKEASDRRDELAVPPHDRGHDSPPPLAGDAVLLRVVAKFAQCFKQSPDRMELAEVRTYHVVFNVAVSA